MPHTNIMQNWFIVEGLQRLEPDVLIVVLSNFEERIALLENKAIEIKDQPLAHPDNMPTPIIGESP